MFFITVDFFCNFNFCGSTCYVELPKYMFSSVPRFKGVNETK